MPNAFKHEQTKSYCENKKKHIIILGVFLLYLFLTLFTKITRDYFWDFLIMWYAGLYITKGIPLYEQDHQKLIDGEMYAFPYHLPIFIYFLAFLIWLFGESFIAVRLSFIVFAFCNAFLLEHIFKHNKSLRFKNRKILDYVSVIFLLNPFTLLSTIFGLFDNVPLMYLLIAIVFIQKIEKENRYKNYIFSLISGLAIGIGFLTKVFPIIFVPIGVLWLLYKKRYVEAGIFTFSFLGIAGAITGYLFITYPRFKYLGFGWQIDRGALSFSVYYYLFDLDFLPDLIIISLGFLLISAFFIYRLFKHKHVEYWSLSGFYILIFILLYRVYYPHYLIWILPFLTYVGFKLYDSKEIRYLLIFVGIFCLQIIANGIYLLNDFEMWILPNAVMIIASIINFLCILGYGFYMLRYSLNSEIETNKINTLYSI